MTSEAHIFLGMEAVIESDLMRALMTTVERVARSHAVVLITGESGSGKELVARAVHHYSQRSSKPWVDLSCAALPEHLLESELFGYEKGAFSGAEATKPGLFEIAHTGTIFLDEIGELEPRMQVKLLRVLDSVAYYRLGGVKKVSVDVRVVAATNHNLETAVAAGKFRGDLYHRLAQLTLKVPPLRQRVRDIAPLARHFLAQHDPELRFSSHAIQALERQPWPGNIRELRNVVTQAAVLTRNLEISAGDLDFGGGSGYPTDAGHPAAPAGNLAAPAGNLAAPAGSLAASAGNLEAMEKRAILDALAAADGHQQNAAARLGISRRTLHRKLKLYRPEGEVARV